MACYLSVTLTLSLSIYRGAAKWKEQRQKGQHHTYFLFVLGGWHLGGVVFLGQRWRDQSTTALHLSTFFMGVASITRLVERVSL